MRYTKEQLQEACKESTSFRKVMIMLNIIPAGGNYSTIKHKVKEYGIDTSHFLGKGWNRGLLFKPNPPALTKDLLVSDSKYQSSKLRKRLLKESYFEHKCYSCKLTEWMGFPIKLELEHIDGNHSNNQIENLTLLCPNCHSLTPTWRKCKSSLPIPPQGDLL